MSGAFLAAAPDAALDAVALTAQVTLLLLLTLALAWSGRRGASRTLHLLWTATFALVLALPALGLLGPSWEVPLLPARGGEPAPASIPGSVEAAGRIPALEIDRTREALVLAERARLAARVGGAGSASANAATGRSAVRIAWIVWMMGCGLSLVSLAIAALRLRKLVRTARPVCDPEWVDQAEALRSQLGLRGEIRLLVSGAVTTPMTGGLRRPVILLPAAAVKWSPERRAVVLTHELIHVRRRDVLRQLMRRIVLALYWFHPLGWLAARRAEVASEKACDEEVLALGARPSDYARLLLRLASAHGRRPNVLALPLVKTSQLETRIVAILKRRRPRPSVTRTAVTLTIVSSAGVSVAAAHPVPFDEAPVPPQEARLARGDAVSAAVQPERPGPMSMPARPEARESLDRLARQEIQCPWAGSDSIRTMRVSGGLRVTGWNHGDRTIERSVAGMYLCMRAHGSVVMSDDGAEVRAVGADGWLVLESREDRTQRLVITEGPGGIEYEWSVDDVRRTFDAEARQWHDLMLRIMNGYQEVMEIRGEESTLRGRISAHRGHVSSLRGRISAHRGQVSSLRGRISAHRGHVSSLRGRISAHRGHFSSLRGQISAYRGRISSLNAAKRLTARAETRAALEDELRELESRIRQTEAEVAAYDLDGKAQEVEQQIAAYDAEDKAREVEQQIEDYDVSGKVAAIEAEIEAYDLEGKGREIERLIEEVDADRRIEEIEGSLEDEIAALRRLVGSTG
ncbi:M56 family metallopeptidase [Candidatus Palauibacter sp.]|uniref:M56 family metallopeptidase n=1 Tax=Candidatus Palauibacter sp. TaxID=3101350 RepID=UPI003B0146E5